jgi:hypothetical protein
MKEQSYKMTASTISPIFIGGTGRSGTTILSKILSKHSEVYSFDQELRFLTDPDGLISLKHSLVDHWSFFHGDMAIERFKSLMSNLKLRYVGKYPNHGLSEHTSNTFYDQWIDSYISSLIEYQSNHAWAGKVNLIQKGFLKLINPSEKPFLINKSYYCSPHTEELFIQKTQSFMNDLYNQISKTNKKKVIVEHTPSNLVHLDFLIKILPSLKLIHIHRDPRDIIASYKTKDWGSNDVLQNAKWIQDVLYRWESIKKDIPNTFYLEIAFEQLIRDPEKEIRRICKYINIPFEKSLLNIDLSKHNIGRWENCFSESEKNKLNAQFAKLITKNGINEIY